MIDYDLCCFQREKLKITMETLGDIMTYHESCSSDCPESSLVQHRLAYVATAVFTIRLLQTILPLEKVSLLFFCHSTF